MLNIQKLREPRELTEHRCQQNACYENIPEQARNKIMHQLLEEQGYLCAYCMARISIGSMKIEHVLSRSECREMQLAYSNLVDCCKGNEGQPHENQHCDTYKGSKSLSKNPANPNDRIEENIFYDFDGKIHSYDTDLNQELETVLNLNIPALCNNRKSVRRVVFDKLSTLSQNAGRNEIEKLLQQWQNKDTSHKLNPYAGVAVYFLKKRLQGAH